MKSNSGLLSIPRDGGFQYWSVQTNPNRIVQYSLQTFSYVIYGIISVPTEISDIYNKTKNLLPDTGLIFSYSIHSLVHYDS